MGFILILVLIALVVVVIIWFYRLLTDGNMSITDDSFAQRGVKVVYSKGTIEVKGRVYKAADIRGIELERNWAGRNNTCKVRIKFDDMHKPYHDIMIHGLIQRGEAFYDRLSIALEKAGANLKTIR